MTSHFLMQVTLAKGETRYHIVRPGAQKKEPGKKLSDQELCWVEVHSGAIIGLEPDWVVSLQELEERLSA